MFTQLQGYIPVRYDAAKGRIVATVCTPVTLNGSISFDGNIDSVYKMDSVAVAPASIPQSPIAVSRLKSNSFSVSLQPGRYVLYGMSQKTKPRRLPLGEVTVGKAGAHISRTVTRAMLQKSLDPVERK